MLGVALLVALVGGLGAEGASRTCKARGGKETVGVATYVTDEKHAGYANLQRSLEAHGWGKATNVGAGAEWEAGDEGRWVRRAQAYLRYAEQQEAERVVVLVDGHDVLFQGGPERAVEGLARSGKEVLVAGERLCETDGCLAGQEQQEARAPAGTTMRFANAGMVVGRAGRVAAFLRDVVRAMERGMVDDQAGVVEVLGAGKHAAGVDFGSEVFGVVSPAAEHFDDDWAVDGGALARRRGGARPVAVHFAGMRSGGALATPCQRFLATKYNALTDLLARPAAGAAGRRVVAVVVGGSPQRALLDGLLAQTTKPDAVYVEDASLASEYAFAHHSSGMSTVLEKEKEAATLVVTLGSEEGEVEGTLVEELCSVQYERLRVAKAVVGGVAPWWRPSMTVSPCNLAGAAEGFLRARRTQRSYAALEDVAEEKKCSVTTLTLPEKAVAYGTNCTVGKKVWPGKSCAVRRFGEACLSVKCTEGTWTSTKCFDVKEAVKTVKAVVSGFNALTPEKKKEYLTSYLALVSEMVTKAGVPELQAIIKIVMVCPRGENGVPDLDRCVEGAELDALLGGATPTSRALELLADEESEIVTAVAQEDVVVEPTKLEESLKGLGEGTKIGDFGEVKKAAEVVANLPVPCQFDELAKFLGSGTASGTNCTRGGKVAEGAECEVAKVGEYCVPAKCHGNNRWVTECRPVEQAVQSYAFFVDAPFDTMSEAERKELAGAVVQHLQKAVVDWAGKATSVGMKVTELCLLGEDNKPVDGKCVDPATGTAPAAKGARGATLAAGGTYGKVQVTQEAGREAVSPAFVQGALRDAMKKQASVGKYSFVSDAAQVELPPQPCPVASIPLPAGAVAVAGCEGKPGTMCPVTKAGHFCIAAKCAAVGSVWTAPLCYPLADSVKVFEVTTNTKFSAISDKAAYVSLVKGEVEKVLNKTTFTTLVESVCPLDAQGAIVKASCWSESSLEVKGRVAKALEADDTKVVFRVTQSTTAATTPPADVVAKVQEKLAAGKKFAGGTAISGGLYTGEDVVSTMCAVDELTLPAGSKTTNCTAGTTVAKGTECVVTKEGSFCLAAKCVGLVWDVPTCSAVADAEQFFSLNVATPYSTFADQAKRTQFTQTVLKTVSDLLVQAGGMATSFTVSLAQVCAVEGSTVDTKQCWEGAADASQAKGTTFAVVKVVQDTSSPSLSAEAVESTMTGSFPSTLPSFGAVSASSVARVPAPTPAPTLATPAPTPAPTPATPAPTPAPTTGSPGVELKPEDDDDGLDGAEVAGIVVAIVLGIGLIAGGIYMVLRSRKSQIAKPNEPAADSDSQDSPAPVSKAEV